MFSRLNLKKNEFSSQTVIIRSREYCTIRNIDLSRGVVSYSESSIQAYVTGFETKISIMNSINSDIFEKSAVTYSVIRFFACYVTRQIQ